MTQAQEWVEIERGAYNTQTKCKDVEIDVIVAPDTIMKNHPRELGLRLRPRQPAHKASKRNYPTHRALPIKRLGKAQKAALRQTQYLQILKCEGMRKAYDGARERRKLLGLLGRTVR